MGTYPHPSEVHHTSHIKMAALCSVAPVVAKVPAVSTGKASKSSAMQVWNPTNNKFFETFSFLPPLSDQEIARQVQYLINNGWAPCIEFEGAGKGYCDNRYWVMWKLPMYGCTSPDEVLAEVRACTRAFPDCFIRVAGFDNIKQVQ